MQDTPRRQSGFTLVEIAIVLVIIGLLLGGILKGQELINSARVRNMADMNAGIQAAYYGFIDRFRRVPGDWSAGPAAAAIGVPINGGGNDNGRIDNRLVDQPLVDEYEESKALWEQLSKAGFIQGAYRTKLGGGAPDTNSNETPLNAFNHVILLGRTADYIDRDDAAGPRLNLMLGRGVPVDIARELDVKLDDGVPDTGVLRLSVSTGATFGELTEGDPLCVTTSTTTTSTGGGGNPIYNITEDRQDCSQTFLY